MADRPDSSRPALRVGTSGWHYGHWWGAFYPAGLRRKDALRHYAARFDCAELNAPFYRTPTPAAVQGWYEGTPDDFRFAWKASKYITHWRRLLATGESLDLTAERYGLLRDKAGPLFFQLPPQMRLDRERLARFMDGLDPAWRCAFEFRHPSWYEPAVFDLLAAHDAALCISDHAAAPAPREATASFVYVRNHGPGGRYHGSYDDPALADWARSIREWRDEGREVWCFFDNDVEAAAPADAARLLRLFNDR